MSATAFVGPPARPVFDRPFDAHPLFRDAGLLMAALVLPTLAAMPLETRVIDGEEWVLERGLTADLAIDKAWKGDTEGNLVYRKTARNFNPMMASAGRVTIAEVEHLVQPGELDPDHIHTPGIFVQRIIQGTDYRKPIEQRTVRQRGASGA